MNECFLLQVHYGTGNNCVLSTLMPETKDTLSESVGVMPMLSLQQSDVSGGLVAIENSTPEVIHVVNVSSPQHSHQIASIDSSNMQTITISAGSLNFPLNLVCASLSVI